MNYFALLQIILPVFLVMGAGYGMRKIGILSAEADQSLIRVVVALLAPCLALDTIIGNEAFRIPENWILPPLLGFASIVFGLSISRLGARVLGMKEGPVKRTFIFATAVHNYGYIALPVCHALFEREAMGVLFAFMLGVDIAFWSIALWQLTGKTEKGSWKQALNPPVVTIPVAMVLNALGAEHWLPGALRSSFHFLGVCAVPMALLLSGALIADYMNISSLKKGTVTTVTAAIIRLGIAPALMLLVTWLLPVDRTLKEVLVVEAAMPAAIFPIVLAKVKQGDVPTALQVVLGTSLIGLVTIPLWLSFGMRYILGG